MNIFLCWSGERSRKVSEALKSVVDKIGGKTTSFMSPQIPKGEVWFEAVSKQLAKADAAIVTLTPENSGSPWLHYEAGAIAQRFRAGARKSPRIFTYLFGVAPGEISGPLGQYQHTEATKAATLALFAELSGSDKKHEWLQKEGESLWEELVPAFREAAFLDPLEVSPQLSTMFRRKTFDEPLAECVAEGWIDRYSVARESLNQLQAALPIIRGRCRRYAVNLAEQLAREIDIYAMTMRATLLKEVAFPCEVDGRLEIPPSIEMACERSRRRILKLQAALADEASAPVFEDSPRFEALEIFDQKKEFVHRKKAELEEHLKNGRKALDWPDPKAMPSKKDIGQAHSSSWALDRILSYEYHLRSLKQEKKGKAEKSATLSDALEWCWQEWEKISARDGEPASRMPLHHCLEFLEEILSKQVPREQRAIDELLELRDYLLEMEKGIDQSKIRRRLLEWDRKYGAWEGWRAEPKSAGAES